MTKEEAIYKAKHMRKVRPNICIDAEDFWETVIAALEQEPCDAVSREAVLEQTYNWSKDEFLRVTNPFDYLRKRINSLPSVTPAEKVGHWIMHIDDLFPAESTMECDQCHEHQPITIDDNYCPNCGCKMQGVEK